MNEKKTADDRAIEGILSRARSPLPPWTIQAFKRVHPAFDLAGYFTVMQCESGLGTTGGSARYNNPGNIKYRAGGEEIWHTLATGKWFCPGQGWYNVYPDMYTGQRAAIRLIWEWGYNAQLAAHQWEAFANRWYGERVPGKDAYVRNLRLVHKRFVTEAATYGATW